MSDVELQDVVERTPEAGCLVGGPATGKTEEVAARACRMAREDAGAVLVVCASEALAEDMRERISRAGDEVEDDADAGAGAGGRIEVLGIRSLAMEVMADPAAAAFKRSPRVMNAQEEADFVEDMRSSTLKGRRLRNLIGFLERGWSELADDDPNWLLTTEEEAVVKLAQDNLRFTGGILPAEASALAFKTLRTDDEATARHARAHVLVDDYQLLGRASQALVNRLASQSILVAADELADSPADDPYPYDKGLEEFLAANPEAKVERLDVCHRPAAIVDALNRLRRDVSPDCVELRCADEGAATDATNAGEGKVIITAFEDGLVDEFGAIAKLVERERDAGRGPVYVAGLNGTWRANLSRYLEQCGLSTAKAGAPGRSGRRGRSKGGEAAGEAALARLAADPHDALAWRSWVGSGDALSRSASVGVLRGVAVPRGLRLDEALHLLAGGQLEGADPRDAIYQGLVSAYAKGKRKLRELEAGKTTNGEALSKDEADGPDGAEEPQAAPDAIVGTPSCAHGKGFDLVVFGGFVNGFIPTCDYFDTAKMLGSSREREHRKNVQDVCLCLAAARRQAAFTGFTSCGLETAEHLGLHIERIAVRDGARVCTIQPSELLALVQPEN